MPLRKLGLWSGVGLVMADMVGAGVLTTSGFMAADLGPRDILLVWLAGGVFALCGALAYAALCRQVPRSGGEYRYLSTLAHPAIGYLAGWTSLLVGFAVPVALAALAAGAFSEAVFPEVAGRTVAVVMIGILTAIHATDLQASKWTQDGLVLLKVGVLAAFVGVGLFLGNTNLPTWSPSSSPIPHGSTAAFFAGLVLVTFCYSGWNAATYAADEFEQPRRDVPRAMIIGTLLVTGLYLLVNWVLLANLSPTDVSGWAHGDTDRITLAHLVMTKLVGPAAARLMSAVIVVSLMSAISAMTLIGPRVYSAMAKDGFLPLALAAKQDRPPVGSVVLQGGLALLLVFSTGFRELLANVSSILALVSALTVLSLFRRSRWREGEQPGVLALGSALVFAVLSGWMIYFAARSSRSVEIAGAAVPTVILWMAGIVVVATTAYAITRRVHPGAGTVSPPVGGLDCDAPRRFFA